ncbi:unnamed protein product [Prorocentrum cordatum]|uniref:Phosphodiesterase I n=1 Tax=Prorocentrum cordatum TaxID=2364126 RepID=A0ABN9W2H2_9DINO|nr:unnamed protein product [Polarella glacialis]
MFFRVIAAASKEFFALGTEQGLWKHFYPIISESFGMMDGLGQPEHEQAVWNRARASKTFQRMGARVKLGRWWSWFKAHEEKREESPVLLMILVYIGLRRGYWNTLEESPLFSSTSDFMATADGEVGLAFEDCAVGEDEGEMHKVPMALSNEQLKILRARSKNSIVLACRILANRFKVRLMDGIYWVLKPCREHFGKALVTFKTKRGLLEYHQNLAQMKYVQELSCMFSMLSDPGLLEACDFESCEVYNHGDALEHEEKFLSTRITMMMLSAVAHRLCSCSYFPHGVPGMFVLLLHHDRAIVDGTLAKLRNTWDRLQKAETLSHSSTFWDKYVRELYWPLSTWPREVFIALEETDFKKVPALVERTVRERFSAMYSDMVESAVKQIRDQENKNSNSQCGRVERWHTLLESSLLSDNDRPGPNLKLPVLDEARAKTLPEKTFEGDVHDVSFGMDALKGLAGSSWPSPSPLTFNLAPMRLEALVGIEALPMLERAWRSVLAQRGDVLFHEDFKQRALVVLESSSCGLWAWRFKLKKPKGQLKYCEPVLSQGDPLSDPVVFLSITDWTKYRVCLSEMLPPSCQRGVGDMDERPGGILRAFKGKPQPLLEIAARRGFRGMQVPFLKKLLASSPLVYERAKDRPNTEVSLVRALVSWACPAMEPSDVDACLAKRMRKRDVEPLPSALSGDGGLAAGAEDMLDASDLGDVKEQLLQEKEIERQDRHSGMAAKAGGSSSGSAGHAGDAAGGGGAESGSAASGSGSAPAVEKRHIPDTGGYPREECLKYLPPGYTLKKETSRYNRWQISTKDKSEPPYSYSATWGDGGLDRERATLMEVLRTAWDWSGAECPWILE